MPTIKAAERARIARRANTLTLDLPATLVQALGLREGEQVEIRPHGATGFEVVRVAPAADALENLRRFRGRLPADFFADEGEGAW
ncbi:AbrB/MazE/SpoVT family DNA-binding domain-containing protein [Paraburkholderia sp. J41]|uniref:AbrB/MazE/SpoVT family DNA-binding domain-containing protein n=1 Tax=Paraburkholderia sp. J41 TaxID=2805433 RepID=UPI002AC32EC7|nr:AbrB/MazE/SpoVT family DNA-binding domain-containing protein [Paraburkholderia sp. J41]